MKFLPALGAVFCSACFLVSSVVSANTYNEGFIAAETGDYKTAIAMWGPLADQGHPLAQFNVALLYHSGAGVPLNEAEAIVWYTKAAENGYYQAQEYLAAGYQEGWFGLPQDSKLADYWAGRIESGK